MPSPPQTAQTHWTLVNGVPVHSVSLANGPASPGPHFVLVHGLGMSCRYMLPMAELLAASGTVHVPDLPGFGRSGKPAHPLTQRIVNITRRYQNVIIRSRVGNVPTALLDVKVRKYPDAHCRQLRLFCF